MLERLKLGTYGDIYNTSQQTFEKVVEEGLDLVEEESEEEDLEEIVSWKKLIIFFKSFKKR